MTNLKFNETDIKKLVDKLVDKLDPVTSTLNEQERMLLVAIFAAAASQAAESGTGIATLPVPEFRGQEPGAGARKGQQPTAHQLKEQLLNGYVPGKELNTVTHSTDKVVGTRKLPGSAKIAGTPKKPGKKT
jgi:hypothetical protein